MQETVASWLPTLDTDFFYARIKSLVSRWGQMSVVTTWRSGVMCDVYIGDRIRFVIRVFSRVQPGYKDIGLCNTLPITSDILWYQLNHHYQSFSDQQMHNLLTI
jgi:hypothetical protein